MTQAVIGDQPTRVKSKNYNNPRDCWPLTPSADRQVSSSGDTSNTRLDEQNYDESTMINNQQQINTLENRGFRMEALSSTANKRLKSTKTKRKHIISKTSLLVGGKVYLRYLVQLAVLSCVILLTHNSAISGQTSQGSESRAIGCPYPSVGTNCQVNIVAQVPAVPLFSTDYIADEYATLKPDTQAAYKCDQGYELLGQDTVTCLSSGRWSASPPSCVTNIAMGKPTNQSSTVKGGDSKNANDGRLITQHDSKHCTETRVDQSPWWQIDLLQVYEVKMVRLLGRACCNPSLSLHDIEIRVGNSSTLQGNRLCAWNPNNLDEGVSRDFQCAHPINGRFVSIQMVGIEAALSLCEVMVFSTREFPPERCNVQSNLAPTNKAQLAVPTTTSASATTTPSSNGNGQTSSDNQMFVFNRTCYEMQLTNGGSFLVADTYCKAKGGTLVHSINNLTQAFISQELERAKSKLKSKLVWIGAKRENSTPVSLVSITSGSMAAAIATDEPQSPSALVAPPLGRSLSASLDEFSAENIFSDHGGLLFSGEASNLFDPTSIGRTSLYQASIGSGGSTSRGSQTFGLSSNSVQNPLNRSSDAAHSPQRSLIVSQPNQLASFFNQPIPAVQSSSSVLSATNHPTSVVAPSHSHRSLRPPSLVSTAPPQQQSNQVQPGASSSSNHLSWTSTSTSTPQSSQSWRWVGDGPSDTISSPITGFLWADDQPNNYNNQQDCIALDSAKRWLWNDVTCELDYLPWICQYRAATCGSPDRNENSTILELSTSTDLVSHQDNIFQFGKTITYTCPVGHKLEGPRQRRCQYDGTWSGKAPRCQYVNCGPINVQPIENGRIVHLNQSQTTYGSQIRYICYEDYVLVGNDLRQCGSDGKWTGKQPFCAYKWCPMLQQIPNGFLNVSSYSENSIASYQCNSGYKLIGNDTRQCLLGGKWTNQEPFCQYVDCGQPKQIANGNYQLVNKTTNYLSVAHYSCNENYTLVGTSNRMLCSHTNRWTGKEPQCSLIDCGQPQSNPGTSFTGNSFTVHSSVEYKCDPGFKEVSGSPVRTCGLDGQWTGLPLTCKYVDCGRVPAILKGEVGYINGTTYLASQVTYECTPGNRLSGHRVRFCGPDGRWTGTSPKCEEVRCDAPELPNNGSAIYIGNDRSFKEQSFSVGVTVQYECDHGHVVKGSWASRLCQANGEWSGEAPVCQFVDCGLPASIENGNYVLKHPPSGTVGSATPLESTRRSDSTSSSSNGAYPATQLTYYGAVAHYNCDSSYKLNGPSQRECLESGQWRQPLPICEPVQCPKPEFFDEYTQVSLYARNSLLAQPPETSSSSSSSSSQQHSMDQSAILSKSVAIKLIANNQWINHELSQQFFGIGDKLHYSCIAGYELYGGPENRVCTQYGQWSGSSTPRCRLIDCGRPAPIGQEGRFYLLNETTTFNSVVEYTCVRPFKLVEQKIRQAGNLIETLQTAQAGVTQILTSLPIGVKVCANNGHWMPNDQQPKCVASTSSTDDTASVRPGIGQFDGSDNTLDGINRNQASSTPTNNLGSSSDNGGILGDDSSGQFDSAGSQHHNHELHLLGNATSLWAKIIIAICLMVMFGLIMLTVICIRSGKKSNKQAQRSILQAANGHPQTAAMQIQLATAAAAHNSSSSNNNSANFVGNGGVPGAKPIHHQSAQLHQLASQNIYMNGHHPKLFTNPMGASHQADQVVSSLHHMTTMHMAYGELGANMKIQQNGQQQQQSSMMTPHIANRSMVGVVGSGGEIMMNGKSSSLGLVAGSERHLNGGNINEHSMSLSSANIIDSYSRLSIESDALDKSSNSSNNNNININQSASSSTAKTIRHNPNGLVTFVSPAQQPSSKQMLDSTQPPNGPANAGHQHSSPQSISTSLSISSSSSPSSSSSAHHTTATRLSGTDSSSSSSGSNHNNNNPPNGHLNANADYQSPQQQSFGANQQQQLQLQHQHGTPQLSPPSLPAHPPPSHRLQHHQKQLVVVRRNQHQYQHQHQHQQQQRQVTSSQQAKMMHANNNNNSNHYMDPSI